jgi:hypothetical protein
VLKVRVRVKIGLIMEEFSNDMYKNRYCWGYGVLYQREKTREREKKERKREREREREKLTFRKTIDSLQIFRTEVA